MKRVFAIIVCFCLAAQAVSFAEQAVGEILPRRDSLVTGTLKNGLTYYIYPNRYPEGEAVYRLFVKAGSLQEDEDQRGLAHFLEHMAFNGMEHFPGDSMVRFLESKGARFGSDLNAHTTYNETVYKFQLPSMDNNLVDTTITILADIAGGLTISEEEMEKERGVIMSEWRQKDNNKGSEVLVDVLLSGSRFADRKTIGDTSVIMNATTSTMRDFYEDWYRPELMAVAVVGDIDPVFVENQIKEKFSSLKKVRKPKFVQYTIEPFEENGVTIVCDSTITESSLEIVSKAAPLKAVRTAEDYDNYLMQAVLNRLASQRFSNLSFTDPEYESADLQSADLLGAMRVTILTTSFQKGKFEESARDAIKHASQMYKYGFTSLEIEQVKNKLLESLSNSAKSTRQVSSSSLMEDIYTEYYQGHMFISPEYEYELAKKSLEKIDSISVLAALNANKNPVNVMVLAPEQMADEIGDEDNVLRILREAYAQEVDRYKQDIVIKETLCEVKTPGTIVSEEYNQDGEFYDWQLSNGARVIYKQTDLDKRRVALSGFRKGGFYSLDSTDYYTALVGSSVIPLSGAGEFSREALNYYLSSNPASMRLLADKTRCGVVGSATHDNMETMFQLLHLKWTGARLDSALCKQVIDGAIESYRSKVVDEEEEFSKELSYLLDGRNYTNQELTDSVIINNVKPERMLLLNDVLFGSAQGFIFTITSNLPAEQIRPMVETYIAGLPSGPKDLDYKFAGRTIPKESTRLQRRASSSERTVVQLTFQDERAPEIDMMPLSLREDSFKSILRTVLLRSLREEHGKVYSVSTASSSAKFPAFLSRTIVAFSCAEEDVEFLIDETLSLIKEIAQNPDSIKDILEDVKTAMYKDYEKDLQNNSFFSTFSRNMLFNEEENWKYWSDYKSMIDSIDAELISQMASRLLELPMIEAVMLPK